MSRRAPTAELTLPLSGWHARLFCDGPGMPMLYLGPVGALSVVTALAPAAVHDQLIISTHQHRSDRGRRLTPHLGSWSLAHGAMMRSTPLNVTFLRNRMLRSPVGHQAQPAVLADLAWIAEVSGHYDEVEVTNGDVSVIRLLG